MPTTLLFFGELHLILSITVMAWLCGYVFVAGLLSATMTLAYSMGEYVIGKNTSFIFLFMPN